MSDALLNARAHRRLRRLLVHARTRWHVRGALEHVLGAALVLAAAAVLAVVTMDAARFAPGVVAVARIAVHVVAAAALAVAVVRIAGRRISDAALAHRIERAWPELDGRVLAAVEVDAAYAHRPVRLRFDGLLRRNIEQAVEACERLRVGRRLEGARLGRAALGATGLVVIVFGIIQWGPPGWRYGAELLFAPSRASAQAAPYRIAVEPAGLVMYRGDHQRLTARPMGFVAPAATLYRRPLGRSEWRAESMSGIPGAPEFEAFLFDAVAGFDYYVAAGGVRSEVFRAEVRELPRVTGITLRYVYPAGTGRPAEVVRESGDIRAVRGTRVEIAVETSVPVDAGELRFDEGGALGLIPLAGALHASFVVEDSGRYQVRLPVAGRGLTPASPVYVIEALADELPTVRFSGPGRDLSVTSIEEVELALSARDDVAVSELEVVMSVNGAGEEVVPLIGVETAAEPRAERTVMLRLEERALAPGDLVAYYARARDRRGDPARDAVTDVYFLDVRPFEKRFHRAPGGGGGGAGGGSQEGSLAAQQRELVIALFNIERDRRRTADAELRHRIGTAQTGQTRIRERTDAIIRRLGTRPVMAQDPNARRVAEELPAASTKMLEVEALLSVREVARALPAARDALLHLQRADAAMRDVQVARGTRGGGGGGAGGARSGTSSMSAAELADLFRLEMDEFGKQYEDVRRARGGGSGLGPSDEVQRELRELARRQSLENERARRRAERGGGSAASQQALADELRSLMRRLERLSREHPTPRLEQSLGDLRAAMDAMGRDGGGAEALERLRRAGERLRGGGESPIARAIRRLRDDSRALRDEHRELAREDARVGEGAPDWKREDVAEQRRALADRLRGLEPRIERLARRAADEGRIASARALREALDGVLDDRTAQRLEGQAPGAGDGVADDLERLAARADAALEAVERSSHLPLARALEQLRELTRAVDFLDRRGDGEARGGSPGEGRGLGPPRDLDALRARLAQRMRGLAGRFAGLETDDRPAGDVSAVVEALEGLARALDDGLPGDPDRVARLKALERALREGSGTAPTLAAAAGRDEVPSGERETAERYYRVVSEAGR